MNTVGRKIHRTAFILTAIAFVGIARTPAFGASPAAPTNLKCEYCVNPLGIDNPTPRLGWQVNDPDRGEIQTGYQIITASSQANIDNNSGDIWNSGKVTSARQNGVAYAGAALVSRTKYFWKVKTWDKDANESPWSSAAGFETGMLNQSDWTAQWIGGNYNLLRDDWVLDPAKTIAKARLYVTSLGYNEVYINGIKAGDHVCDPAYTKYDRRALYSTYDVTGLMNAQNNGIGIMLGNAYYFNFEKPPLPISASYYNSSSLWVRLEIRVTYTDGSSAYFGTHTSTFKALKGGPVTSNHVFNGERYNARNEIAGWSSYGFNDASWATPSTMTFSGTIKAQLLPMRVVENITPVSITQPQTGYYVYDMGLNMVGWVRLTVTGSAGTVVTLKFAEVVSANGMINQTDLRSAQCTDSYTLKGGGTEVWEPRFTHHGFRYVEVTGFPGTPAISAITGRVIRSDYAADNTFTCSNTLINNIYKMYSRSQRGNSASVPTDCPQRDERQGWGGDATVTSEAALLSFDMISFYEKWFNDIDDSQKGTGAIPATVPDFHDVGQDVAWGSIRVLIPWDLYMATGDPYPLARHYTQMKSFVSSLAGGVPASYGDWVPAGATEAAGFFAAAYYYQNVSTMARIAGVLGNTADQTTYTNLAATLQNNFNTTYLKSSSYYGTNTQAGNAVALQFDIVPSAYRAAVVTSLVNAVASNSNHITTGILGSKAIMEALWKNNRSDIAFTLMTQTTYPSWGYMYNRGPGTIWERWDSDAQIGSGMNSNNHVMYGGGPGAWVYKGLAGISAGSAGYAAIVIKPEVVGNVTSASGVVTTVRGAVVSNWRIETNGTFTLNVTIPANTSADINIPKRSYNTTTWVVRERMGYCWQSGAYVTGVPGITSGTDNGTSIVFRVGSGDYTFQAGADNLVNVIQPMQARIELIRYSRNSRSGATVIKYTLAGNAGWRGRVTMRIFDVRGSLVAEPVNADLAPGSYTAIWQGNNRQGNRLAAGTYFLRMQIGNGQCCIRRLSQW